MYRAIGFFFCLLSCAMGFGSWEFIDKKGDIVTLDWVKTGDLIEEEAVFVNAFLEAYKDYSEETLGVQDKPAFLHEAFSDFHQELLSGKQTLIVAKVDGKTVGFAGFEPTETLHQVYITQCAVSPEYSQTGIGRELVFSVFKLFEDTDHLVVITRRINERAQKFYHRLGFTECAYMHPGYNPQKYVGYEWRISNNNRRSPMNSSIMHQILQEANEAFFIPHAMRLDLLKNCPEAIPTLTEWLYETWKPCDDSLTKEKLTLSLKQRLNDDRLPMAFVAFQGPQPVGSLSLKKCSEPELADFPADSLWASLHIVPEERNKSWAQELLKFAEKVGTRMGHKELYIYTSDPLKAAWYTEKGLHVVEKRPFRSHTITILRLPFSTQ